MKTYTTKLIEVEHAHSSLHPARTRTHASGVLLSTRMKVVIQSYCYACSNTGKDENHNRDRPFHFLEWKYTIVTDLGSVMYQRQCFHNWNAACASAKRAWPRVMSGEWQRG